MQYSILTRFSLTAIMLSTLTGCGASSCQPSLHPGMSLQVQDTMGEAVPLCGATVLVNSSDGELVEYFEFLEESCDDRVSATYILQGVHGDYQITVSKDGYEDAVVDLAIEMDSSGCFPVTDGVIAQLEPR